MKNPLLLLALSFLSFVTLRSFGQTEFEKKLIATLEPGETLVYGENCFLLDRNPESISFVTVKGSGSNKEYYCYGKDGKKTGPVKQPDESYWKDCKEVDFNDCLADREPKQGDLAESIDWTTGEIKFNGKTYGSNGQLMIFNLSDDGQNFYAISLSPEMKIIFFDNQNRQAELVTFPEKMIISPDGTKACAIVKGSINPYEPGALEKMMDNPELLNNPPINLICIDGKNYGPYTEDGFSEAWYVAPSKLAIYNNLELSLDGKSIIKTGEYISPCNMWISITGTNYAIANYETMTFSDGSRFVAPIVIKYTENSGKSSLKWISLDDGKNLTFYKKEF